MQQQLAQPIQTCSWWIHFCVWCECAWLLVAVTYIHLQKAYHFSALTTVWHSEEFCGCGSCIDLVIWLLLEVFRDRVINPGIVLDDPGQLIPIWKTVWEQERSPVFLPTVRVRESMREDPSHTSKARVKAVKDDKVSTQLVLQEMCAWALALQRRHAHGNMYSMQSKTPYC